MNLQLLNLNPNLAYIKKEINIENTFVNSFLASLWNFVANACNPDIGTIQFVILVKFIQKIIEDIKVKSYSYEELEILEMIALRYHSLTSIIFSFYRSKYPFNNSFVLILVDTAIICRDLMKDFFQNSEIHLQINRKDTQKSSNDQEEGEQNENAVVPINITSREILEAFDYFFNRTLIANCFKDKNKQRIKTLMQKLAWFSNDRIEHMIRIEFDVARNEKSDKMSFFSPKQKHLSAQYISRYVPKGNELSNFRKNPLFSGHKQSQHYVKNVYDPCQKLQPTQSQSGKTSNEKQSTSSHAETSIKSVKQTNQPKVEDDSPDDNIIPKISDDKEVGANGKRIKTKIKKGKKNAGSEKSLNPSTVSNIGEASSQANYSQMAIEGENVNEDEKQALLATEGNKEVNENLPTDLPPKFKGGHGKSTKKTSSHSSIATRTSLRSNDPIIVDPKKKMKHKSKTNKL
ncbi:unnamed protein product [Gordionus sp. m RMFG-2023]